jgi:hypothetical protein
VPAEAPATFVGVTVEGVLVRIDRATGEVIDLARDGDPGDPGHSELGPSYIEGAISSPVGSEVYYSKCCEPAVGSIYRLDSSGSAERIYDGSPAAISPDGQWLAVANGSNGISIHQIGSYASRWIPASPANSEAVSSISFDPAGRKLILGLTNHQGGTAVGWVDVDATGLSEMTRLQPPAGEQWSSPALSHDGRLHYIASGSDDVELCSASQDGQGRRVVDLGGRTPVSASVDASGGWLLVAFADGAVGVVGPDGTLAEVIETPSLVAADW